MMSGILKRGTDCTRLERPMWACVGRGAENQQSNLFCPLASSSYHKNDGPGQEPIIATSTI